ncbi:MAG TPA: CoA pyrophosphatase [Parvularculaceae bacterium]|nr:CoA pyrophosphatase [Amphiplicatus sp.]MCB9956049.1 CoA pyrophosphatase [Caulobacterales bacterium]HOP18820.1 CoA pyrophosphatase [Amphiplicatus sp.]HPE31902.1 CoA pyrophosphatase [Parvularculaceae bacterium]HRX37937.1 CoA pyrophosphatase [Parvularculaceae bacterium]
MDGKDNDPRTVALSGDHWRETIARNLQRASAQRVRALFAEMNPHLVGDKLFEDRWSDIRRDAAVLVPILPRLGGPTVLMTVRSADMPSHAGQISFPGGKAHPEDNGPVATALRESFEEVNIAPEKVDVIGALGVHQGGLGFSVTPIVGVIDPSVEIRPCPREVAEIFEVPLSFIADLANHTTEARSHKGVSYNMFAAPYGRYHIWGLTAGILRTLAETLQEHPTISVDAAAE